jgi:hypothetical protein
LRVIYDDFYDRLSAECRNGLTIVDLPTFTPPGRRS